MYNYTANRSTAGEYNFGCSNCHTLALSNHTNGTIDITLKNNEAGVGSLRSKNNTTGAGIGFGITGTTKTNIVCTAAYCHSNGNAANLIYAATPNWYGGSFSGDRCANCHGNSPNSTIAGSKSHYNTKFLGYTSNAGGHQIGIHAMEIYSSPSGLAKAGTSGDSSHGNAGTSTTINCNVCHYATVTSARNDSNMVCKTCHYSGNTVGAQSGNMATIADRSRHVNGMVDIAFQPVSILSKAQIRPASFNMSPYSSAWKRNVGYKVNGAYDSAKGALNTATMWNGSTKTCSNVACHNRQSVKWGDNDGATACISCHTAL
jgi:predicted CxxxxCH...CXXCH cytochrome family protein